MLMSVRVRLALTARASDRSPSVPMLLLLTDRLTEEGGGGGEEHVWEGVLAAVGGTHALRPQPGDASASLMCTAPSL